MKKVLIFLYFRLLSALLIVCCSQSSFSLPSSSPAPTHWLTVFVHGIMSIQPYLSYGNIHRFFTDDVEDCEYATAIDVIRNDPFFYQNQAMQGYGMLPIDTQFPNQFNIPAVKANLFDRMQKLAPHPTPIINHFYTFGWTGLMSHTARYNEAVRFYEALEHVLLFHFHRHGIFPKIRLIGYSHGGNLCLNLAAARQQAFPNSQLTINELILLGTPIQRETDHLILDPLFERVYNVYSRADRVQTLDIFSAHRSFSKRTFANRGGFKLPEKLTQIELKIMRPRKGAEKNPKKLEKTNDLTDSRIRAGKHPLLRDSSPGHGELWFFGWTPHHYRRNFPLHPFPAVTLIPFITSSIPQLEKELTCPPCPAHPIVADIRPRNGFIMLKYHDACQKATLTIPFLSAAQFTMLQEEVLAHKPPSYTQEEYRNRTRFASQEAKRRHTPTDAPQKKSNKKRMKQRKLCDIIPEK